LGLGFKNPTKEDSYLKSATPNNQDINIAVTHQKLFFSRIANRNRRSSENKPVKSE
jgi:hypothetical protein